LKVNIFSMPRLQSSITYAFCLLIIWLGINCRVAAQETPRLLVGAAFQQGAVIMHTAKIKHFAGTNPTGLELNVQYQTTGKKYWQQLYAYPRIGASFTYLNYHQPVLGQSFALSTYMSLPVFKKIARQLHFRFGPGLAYFSNKFDRTENPGNNVISSTWNAVIQTRLEYDFPIHPRFSGLAAFGLNHYSNGGNSKPNLGMNIATATLGINFLKNTNRFLIQQDPDVIKQRYYFTLSSSLGIKQRNDFDTARYIVKSVALMALHRINLKSTLLLGVEGFYDPSLVARRAWDPRVKPGTTPDIRRVGINAGHELNFGKVAFGTQVGWYVYRPYKADAPFYQRLETKVQLHKNFFIAADLKLHDIIKADIIEYRLGIRI